MTLRRVKGASNAEEERGDERSTQAGEIPCGTATNWTPCNGDGREARWLGLGLPGSIVRLRPETAMGSAADQSVSLAAYGCQRRPVDFEALPSGNGKRGDCTELIRPDFPFQIAVDRLLWARFPDSRQIARKPCDYSLVPMKVDVRFAVEPDAFTKMGRVVQRAQRTGVLFLDCCKFF